MIRARLAIVALLLCAVFCHAEDKKYKTAMTLNPNQSAAVRGLPEVVAEQPCDNWAMAAAIEMMLAKQQVALDQRHWVMKNNGGLTCVPGVSYEAWQRAIEGEYVLDGPKRVRLSVRFTNALPPTTDAFLLPMAYGRAYVILWRGKPYIVTGATWDEFIYRTGQKLSIIKVLALIDPTQKGEQRAVEFSREKEKTSDLGGIFEVVAEDLTTHPWDGPYNPATEPVHNPALDPVRNRALEPIHNPALEPVPSPALNREEKQEKSAPK